MDSDVLIGRSSYEHSYLSDMIDALSENKHAISVGFNIPKKNESLFVDYHAPEGGFKPEVRFSLLYKKAGLKKKRKR